MPQKSSSQCEWAEEIRSHTNNDNRVQPWKEIVKNPHGRFDKPDPNVMDMGRPSDNGAVA
jgi:hypothetical protein